MQSFEAREKNFPLINEKTNKQTNKNIGKPQQIRLLKTQENLKTERNWKNN